MKNGDYVNLRAISDELYDSVTHIRPDNKEYENYYHKNAANIKVIFEALNLMPYQKYIKSERKGYLFSNSSKTFIKKLLESYTGSDMKKLRKGYLQELPDSFIVWLVEGMVGIFETSRVSDDVVAAVRQILWNYTDYPKRKRNLDMINFFMRISDMVEKIFTPMFYSCLTPTDGCIWLDRFSSELDMLCEKWISIYDEMGEIRREEVYNSAKEYAVKLTEKQRLVTYIEFEYGEELNTLLENDKKLQRLKEDFEKERNRKTGFSKRHEENLIEAVRRITKREYEIRTEFFRKKLQDSEFVEPKEADIDLSFLSPSNDVLAEAIASYKEKISHWRKDSKNK